MRNAVRISVRLGFGFAVLAVIVLGIGMLPGHIEGVYRGMGIQCMCDSVHFMQFRDGKVIMYSSNHSPADLLGRYETNTDRSVAVYLAATNEGEPETLLFTATPRFWFTRFKSASGNSAEWHWKTPVYGIVEKTISDQEVSSSIIKSNHTVAKTIYNSALQELRTETKQLQTRAAKGSTGGYPASGSNSK